MIGTMQRWRVSYLPPPYRRRLSTELLKHMKTWQDDKDKRTVHFAEVAEQKTRLQTENLPQNLHANIIAKPKFGLNGVVNGGRK